MHILDRIDQTFNAVLTVDAYAQAGLVQKWHRHWHRAWNKFVKSQGDRLAYATMNPPKQGRRIEKRLRKAAFGRGKFRPIRPPSRTLKAFRAHGRRPIRTRGSRRSSSRSSSRAAPSDDSGSSDPPPSPRELALSVLLDRWFGRLSHHELLRALGSHEPLRGQL